MYNTDIEYAQTKGIKVSSTMKDFQCGMAVYGDDSSLHVKFYVRELLNERLSEESGRPIYESKEFIQIMFPGNDKTVFDQPVNDNFRHRFPEQYARFKEGQQHVVVGSLLEHLPNFNLEYKEYLNSKKIYTVEQLAGLADASLQGINLPNITALRKHAQNWLSLTKDSKLLDEYESRITNQNLEIQRQAKEIAELRSLICAEADQDKIEEPRKRGRPPKQKEAA